jgi:hypothetical protein
MGVAASSIWKEICALESDTVRAHMIETVLRSPDLISQAKMVGVYGTVMAWLAAHQSGSAIPFPYSEGATQNPRSVMYTTPTPAQSYRTTPPPQHPSLMPSSAFSSSPSTAIMVSPSAKAHDYFQEAVEMLGIGPDEQITQDRLRSAYKRASLRAHPDKGGSKGAFDEVNRAYRYVEKILVRINPRFSTEGSSSTMPDIPSMTISDIPTQTTTMSINTRANTVTSSSAPAPPPVKLSAKKLDMTMFNKMFEENRMPDPDRDSGYGNWMKSGDSAGAIGADPRLKGKFSSDVFESVFRERVATGSNGNGGRGREELYAQGGVEIGGASDNFTAAFGSDNQFTDIKEAYTSAATMFQHVADVQVGDRRIKSADAFKQQREAELARKDPAEAARFQAEVDAAAQRERQRQARVTEQEKMTNSWAEGLRQRLMVSNS